MTLKGILSKISPFLYFQKKKNITNIHFKREILIEYQGKYFILTGTANTGKA
jgi:hypothetical protein